MENLRELRVSEMKQISGGSKFMYDLGYAIGLGLNRTLDAISIALILK
jgi:hypothetical protein